MRARSDEGFTLVEMLAVVLILALLIAIAITSYIPSSSRAASVACLNNRTMFDRTISVYLAEHEGELPASLDDLEPYAANFEGIRACPLDGSALELDIASRSVICPTHP